MSDFEGFVVILFAMLALWLAFVSGHALGWW